MVNYNTENPLYPFDSNADKYFLDLKLKKKNIIAFLENNH